MPAQLPTTQQLQHHIQNDIESCEKLLQLLELERSSLKDRQFDLLDDIINQKKACLSHLEQSARQRGAWAQAMTQPGQSIESAWQTWLQDNAAELNDHWQKLRLLMQTCQEQNEVNGKVLARKRQTYERLTGLVRGQSAGINLYNAKGNDRQGGGGHRIGEA